MVDMRKMKPLLDQKNDDFDSEDGMAVQHAKGMICGHNYMLAVHRHKASAVAEAATLGEDRHGVHTFIHDNKGVYILAEPHSDIGPQTEWIFAKKSGVEAFKRRSKHPIMSGTLMWSHTSSSVDEAKSKVSIIHHRGRNDQKEINKNKKRWRNLM